MEEQRKERKEMLLDRMKWIDEFQRLQTGGIEAWGGASDSADRGWTTHSLSLSVHINAHTHAHIYIYIC